MSTSTSSNSASKWARTKIIATVGPACQEPAQLRDLVQAGVDIFRLNMAHTGPAECQPIVERIRQISRELNEPLAILADLAGPKIRLGEIAGESIYCQLGDEFFFVNGEAKEPNELTSTYEPL
jgi:pyruvate kinase